MQILIQPFADKSMGDLIEEALGGAYGDFDSFRVSVAFVKRSGVQHIENELKEFLLRGKSAQFIVGVDLGGTSIEGIEALLDTIGESGELFINHDENSFTTFHPKIYFFEGQEKCLLIVGSGNLTQGGLYSNDEGFAILELNPSNPDDLTVINRYKGDFCKWCDENSETVRRVDEDFVVALKEAGYLPSEAMTPFESDEATGAEIDGFARADEQEEIGKSQIKERLFGRMKGRRRPPRKAVKKKTPIPKPASPIFDENSKTSTGFVMTLMKTDVGTGQTTPGTSRRSPEIFIPLKARNVGPEFWGWDAKFTEDPSKPGKFDRLGVKMRIGGEVTTVNMMTWPVKHDFRLRSEALRSAGEVGDLIKIEKIDEAASFDYYVEIIPKGSSDYNIYLDVCINKTPNSDRKWGYY